MCDCGLEGVGYVFGGKRVGFDIGEGLVDVVREFCNDFFGYFLRCVFEDFSDNTFHTLLCDFLSCKDSFQSGFSGLGKDGGDSGLDGKGTGGV